MRKSDSTERWLTASIYAELFVLLLALGCGNDTRPDSPGGAGAGGQANDLESLCSADCRAQRGLDCVDPSTCQERCRAVFDLTELSGCEREYLQVLECVASEGAQAYVCIDPTSFGFPEGSPCVELSAAVSDCIVD